MLAFGLEIPVEGGGDALRLEGIGEALAGEQAPPVHPGPEIGRDGHVRRGGDDPLGERRVVATELVEDHAEALLRRKGRLMRDRKIRRHGQHRGAQAPLAAGAEWHLVEEGLEFVFRQREPFEAIPFMPLAHARLLTIGSELRGREQAGMVVLVAGQRQAEALDRVGKEDDRAIVVDPLEGLQQCRQIVAGEVGHQPPELVVGALFDQGRERALIAQIIHQPLAPGSTTLEGQRGIELVGAGVDPVAQLVAAGLGEGFFEQRAVFQRHDIPAEGAKQRLEPGIEPLADDGVEALAVVIDDPPGIANTLFPALQQCLEDVALIHLGIADEGDHAPFPAILRPAMRLHVILHDAGKQCLCHAEPDGAGGEVDVIGVLGARGIGLRPLEAAKILQILPALLAEQILDRVIDRARMRLHRDAILGPERRHVERRHDGGERGR